MKIHKCNTCENYMCIQFDNKDGYPREVKPIMQLVSKQAEDWGLWGQAQYASEAYMQSQLRELHKVIEEQFGDCREYEEK